MFVSDFFDFSIYVDADEADIEHWYVARFMTLRDTVFRDPDVVLPSLRGADDDEAREVAHGIWRDQRLNLRENILPTRERAHLILDKGESHAVNGCCCEGVTLRRL